MDLDDVIPNPPLFPPFPPSPPAGRPQQWRIGEFRRYLDEGERAPRTSSAAGTCICQRERSAMISFAVSVPSGLGSSG
jgi:hypothetical protein